MSRVKVLITGSEGLIGSHLINKFDNHDVLTVDLKPKTNHFAEHVQMDILDKKFSNVFTSFNPNIVVHLAAQIDVTKSKMDPVYDAENNVIGTIRLAQLVSKGSVTKFVYGNSGGAIYSQNESNIYTESSKIGPKSPYGISKYAGELYLQNIIDSEKTKFVSLRFANVFGDPNNSSRSNGVITKWLDAINVNHQVEIRNPHASRDFVFVEDVVEAIKMVAIEDFEGIFNVGSGDSSTLIELSDLLGKILLNEFKIVFTSLGTEEVIKNQLCICKIKSVTHWSPRYSLEDALIKMIHKRENLMLRN
jgi:UDP-glucose 4-epimerase